MAALLAGFMPFYMLRIMGAGDVKLMSVVGAFFGASTGAWVQLIGVSLFVLATGGLLAVVRMLYSRSSTAVLGNLRLMFSGYTGRMLGMPAPTFDARTDSADRMPYAVAIAAGTILYLVAKWAGWIKWI
jgi:prepilin peptidase CpaA